MPLRILRGKCRGVDPKYLEGQTAKRTPLCTRLAIISMPQLQPQVSCRICVADACILDAGMLEKYVIIPKFLFPLNNIHLFLHLGTAQPLFHH